MIDNAEIEPCFYCGLPASEVEHVIPRSMLKALGDFQDLLHEVIRGRTLTVRSCRECNSLLGATVQKTLSERRKHLKARLRHKYRDVLEMPKWSEEQLSELGDGMRQHVEAGIRLKRLIQERLRWPADIASKQTGQRQPAIIKEKRVIHHTKVSVPKAKPKYQTYLEKNDLAVVSTVVREETANRLRAEAAAQNISLSTMLAKRLVEDPASPLYRQNKPQKVRAIKDELMVSLPRAFLRRSGLGKGDVLTLAYSDAALIITRK